MFSLLSEPCKNTTILAIIYNNHELGLLFQGVEEAMG
jgi:hypothetical protein